MLGIAGIAVFFAVGLVVSLRLLSLAQRTRRLPELLAGLGLLGIGPLGYCLIMSGAILLRGTPLGDGIRSAGLVLQALGFVASAVFTWRVFRPGSRVARALALGISAALFATLVACWIVPNRAGAMLPHHHLDAWLKIACLAWGAVESLRYWRVTHRRVELGLADPLVCVSFFAWGLALGSGASGFALVWAALLGLAPGEQLGSSIQLALSLCGIVTAASLYLAFLMPRAWARRIREHAHAQAQAV